MSGACLFCGEPFDDRHDVTGRGGDGCYLDPQLLVALCHSDHELAGDDLRTTGLDAPPAGGTFLELLEYRLARIACFLGRLGETLQGPLGDFVRLLARHMARWRAGLAGAIAALDRDSPGWRASSDV
jgi:hypothetical protein